MRTNRLAAAIAAVASLSVLTACSSDSSGDSGSGKVTITVEGWRPGDQQATIDSVKAQAAEFMKANPDIKVVPKEWQWKSDTFPAQLAGGTLPTTFRVPFTDTKGLVARKQVADVNDEIMALPYAKQLNPTVMEAAKGTDGKVYGLPSDVYANGLHYNRELFTKAGLDPDKPPTTWDEVRTAAKAIHDKTGQTGYATMTKENQGGWILTTLSYAMGGRMEEQDGDKFTATVDNDATKQALELIKAMRWEDKSISGNTSYNWGTINEAFSAGKIGMYVSGSDVYNALVTTNKINPDEYGLAAIPTNGGADVGALGGGSINLVSAKATKAQQKAAVKWIDFFRVSKLVDEKRGIEDAKTLAASKQPIGTPTFPQFDEETWQKQQAWLKPYVNVPTAQMSSFLTGMFEQQLIAEPAAQTQALYAALDPAVQKVLADKNADIDALLKTANENVQGILDKS
ncbi:extracellular solute-binding protein [Aeromicrobium panaciterrae]|uniref:ABC transporter substrate-binding protein n=1 Tax=Aeromicrobium panaciterrae TaxID=363861 RepID=UPI0031DD1001